MNIKFSPYDGNEWLQGPMTADEYRRIHKAVIWHSNPWTGYARTPLEVAGDPFGYLIDTPVFKSPEWQGIQVLTPSSVVVPTTPEEDEAFRAMPVHKPVHGCIDCKNAVCDKCAPKIAPADPPIIADPKFLRACAAGMTYNDDAVQAAAKHRLNEIAMRVETNFYRPNAAAPQPTSAPALLDQAAQHMRDRAATYDKPEGERSMARTVEAFNAITGRDLNESEGWLLMSLLKMVRSESKRDPHRDSVEDLVAYSALYGEARIGGK